MTVTYKLPGHLDSAAATPLATELMEHSGKDICIDASDVTFAGTLPLQVLVAARKQWEEDEQSFVISPLSSAFVASTEGLGVPLPDIGASGSDIVDTEGCA